MNLRPQASLLAEPGPAARWGAWDWLVAVGLAALGLFLPFSTAGTALSLAGLLVVALARPRRLWADQPWKEPVMAAGLVLLAYIGLHTLATSGWTEASLHSVNRYHELLFAPVLLFLLRQPRHRAVFFHALMAGAAVVAVACWIAFFTGPYEVVSSRRISAGFVLALTAFLALLHARTASRPWVWHAVAALFAATVLFAIEGRTGHVLVLVLAIAAAWIQSPRRYRLAAAFAVPVLVLMLAVGSPAVKSRLQETLDGSNLKGASEPTSTSIRIAMLHLAWDLSREHGLAGAGFANYGKLQEAAALERFGSDPGMAVHLRSGWHRGSNPHNEYAMQLVGGGVVALGLFLAWLGLAFWRAVTTRLPLGGMIGGAALAFAVAALFNSLLRDFVEGHVYMGLLALLLAGIHDAAVAKRKAPPGRILVVATRQIGDVLLTTPLIHAARERWPQARIDVLGFQGTLGMLQGNPEIGQRIEVAARLGARGLLTLARRLWHKYDLVLVADAGDRAHLIAWLAGPVRSGIIPAGGSSTWWKKRLLVHAVEAAGDRSAVHVVQEKLALLAPWAPEAAQRAPHVLPPEGTPLPAGVASQLRPGAVVVHAPSMWAYKQWPIEHFATVIRGLLAQGRQVVLTGSGSQRDQECIAPLRRIAPAPRLLDVSGQLDFTQLVTLLRCAGLYIGPDTSVSHLAAATGAPVLAVFGPTNPMRWAPWPASAEEPVRFARVVPVQQIGNVTVLQSSKPCVPCGRAGCDDHRDSRTDCLPDISPQRVLDEASRLLAQSRHPVRCAS